MDVPGLNSEPGIPPPTRPNDIIRAETNTESSGAMKLFRLVTGWASALLIACSLLRAQTSGRWDPPTVALADQIAAVTGPGQATLTIRNLSSIADSEVPPIRALLEKNLKVRGVSISGVESANTI